MNENRLISIVTMLSPDRIDQAFYQAKSLQNQEFKYEYEYILVLDGASKYQENTFRNHVMGRLSFLREHLQVVSLPHNGTFFRQNMARNRGITLARGSAIVIADIDFLFSDNFLTTILEAKIRNNEFFTYPTYFCKKEVFIDGQYAGPSVSNIIKRITKSLVNNDQAILQTISNGNFSNKYNSPNQVFSSKLGILRFCPTIESEFFPIATKDTYRAIGMFDERFEGRYFNRMEFCDRIRRLAENGYLNLYILADTFAAHRPHEILPEINLGCRPYNKRMRQTTLANFLPGHKLFQNYVTRIHSLGLPVKRNI